MQPMAMGQIPGQQQMIPGLQRPMQPQQQQQYQMNAQQMHQFQQNQLVQQQLNQALPPGQTPQLQQMQNYNQMQQQQKIGLTNMILGQPAPAPAHQQPAYQGQQGQGALDILGLADKAAQALSGVRLPQVTQVNPNFPPPPAPAPARSYQQHQNNGVTEKQLPMMVQYAIQVRTVC